jgi:hypothetical protein
MWSLAIDYPMMPTLVGSHFSMGGKLARMRHLSLILLKLIVNLDVAEISWKRKGD